MNGPQDLGGMMGFGPVAHENNEPVFHAEWERRIFALNVAMRAARQWNIDASRHARESLPPAQYLRSSYYEIWFEGLKKLLISRGLVTREEIASDRLQTPAKQVTGKLMASDVEAVLAKGSSYNRPSNSPARFAVGDRVRAKNIHPEGHTRLPRYLRGHVGEIVTVHGTHVFPDTNAHGKGENPQWLYSVQFSSREIWGERARAGDTIAADLWEPYLDPA